MGGLTAIAATFLAAAHLSAQTDGFNYTAPPLAAGWATSISANYPGLLTSPTDRFGGQALRMQTTNQIPTPAALTNAPAGTDTQNTPRIFAWRTDRTYTNFYIAVDLVAWDTGTGKITNSTYFDPANVNSDHTGMTNQAYIGLIAWATNDAGSLGYNPAVPVGRPNGLCLIIDYNRFGGGIPNGTRGVINIAYFKDGQPSATTITLQGDYTPDPGHTYRVTFTGTNLVNEFNVRTNDIYYGRIYDMLDLTRPLVTVTASRIPASTWQSSGYSGIFSTAKNIPCNSDVTFDNFVASEYPPTTVSLPATPYGLDGVPQVVNRTPASWTNFYPAVGGIHFTATTLTANTIATSDIRMFLNGVDVTSGLTFGGNPSNRTVNFSGLRSNVVYDARIELANNLGQRTTNMWTFDTFSDTYLASSPRMNIECEDIDFNGSFIDNPIASGFPYAFTLYQETHNWLVTYPWPATNAINQGPTAYVNQLGVNAATNAGVGDYNDTETGAVKDRETEFRFINCGQSQGCEDFECYLLGVHTYSHTFDTQRNKYSSVNPDLQEYLVRRNQGGDWRNYTRTFAGTNYYNVYLRAGCDLSAPYQLDQVSAGPVTNVFGTFNLTNAFGRSNFRYTPLKDGAGKLAVVNLSGVNKIRMLMNCPNDEKVTRGSMLNYMAFVPALLVESSATVNTGYAIDTTAVADLGTGTITIPQSGAARFYRLRWDHAATITSTTLVGGNVVLTYQ